MIFKDGKNIYILIYIYWSKNICYIRGEDYSCFSVDPSINYYDQIVNTPPKKKKKRRLVDR